MIDLDEAQNSCWGFCFDTVVERVDEGCRESLSKYVGADLGDITRGQVKVNVFDELTDWLYTRGLDR